MAKKRKVPKRRNFIAKALELPQNRNRVIPDKRKKAPRHAVRHETDT